MTPADELSHDALCAQRAAATASSSSTAAAPTGEQRSTDSRSVGAPPVRVQRHLSQETQGALLLFATHTLSDLLRLSSRYTTWQMHILGSGSTEHTHTAKQLMTICTVLGRPAAPSQRAGAHVRSRRSKRGRVIPGLLPGKQESVCSINACMTRPVPRPTCQRRGCQARDRQTELKNYSGIHRPRGLGSASTGEATLHRIPSLFQFSSWDANVTKLFGAVQTPDRAASPATDKSGPIV